MLIIKPHQIIKALDEVSSVACCGVMGDIHEDPELILLWGTHSECDIF